MPISAVLSYAAAYLSLIVTVGVLLRDRRSFVHRTFAVGMLLFAAEELFRGIGYGAVLPSDAVYWQKRVLACAAILPVVWLAFSLTYARVNPKSFLLRWKWALAAVAVTPIVFIAVFRQSLYRGATYLVSLDRWSILLDWPGRAVQFFILCI